MLSGKPCAENSSLSGMAGSSSARASIYAVRSIAAVAAMALCFGLVELNEGAYWAAVTRVAGARTMAAAWILNTGGSLGGLIGIPVVAYLSGHGAWPAAFVIGALCAALSGVAWFAVDPTRSSAASDS
jgi:hypothetical protein